jgi:exonuclease SbcD
MKLLHTADWHIGQLFHDYDRSWEHEKFLDWLIGILRSEAIDVLLVSGDVFDGANPSAVSIRMFYTFLNRATSANPGLQVIITAGNHDSAARLEAPKPLLESSNIHIVGVVERDAAGNIDYEKLTIPLKDGTGVVVAWCLAIPFLRMGDYPMIEGVSPYPEGVARVYDEAYRFVLSKKQPGQAVIALGHLHTQQAEVGDMDRTERMIMGGIECVAAAAFHEDIRYVALGHIHRAQRVGSREHVRYSGSPLPMSFAERGYRHQVVIFELNGDGITDLKTLDVPVSVPLMRVPAVHSRVSEAIGALRQLPAAGKTRELFPYLEVCVLVDGPDPGLRHSVEQALAGKAVRLARIDVRAANAATSIQGSSAPPVDDLAELSPLDVFAKAYQAKYTGPVPEGLVQLFREIAAGIDQSK